MELVSESCIVSLLDWVDEVKPTYILLFSEIQAPKGNSNRYITLVFLQNSNRGRGIILNDLLGGFKFIIVYDKFYFFLFGSEGVCFCESMFLIYFYPIYNCSAFGFGKKFDKCLLIGRSDTVFILLANIFNHTFNLFINNTVREPIIDESPFNVSYLFMKYCFGGRDQFGSGYQVINNCFF